MTLKNEKRVLLVVSMDSLVAPPTVVLKSWNNENNLIQEESQIEIQRIFKRIDTLRRIKEIAIGNLIRNYVNRSN